MSEKEVQNLDRFLKSQLKRLAGFLDVHSYSQMWMIPWGFAKENIKDYDELVSYSSPFANLVYDYSERGLHRLFVHQMYISMNQFCDLASFNNSGNELNRGIRPSSRGCAIG